MKNFNKELRRLASTSYYQLLYDGAKNLNLNIFKNSRDYTTVQLKFLQYLNLYDTLFCDFNLGEVDEIVFDNEIYEDSYLLYKRKSKNEPEKKDDKKVKSQWVFKKK